MCQACTPTFNENQANAFAETLVGHLNSAATVLLISVGHRTGLFDTMATLPPATSMQIAEAGNLNERYVREWLGAVTTSGITLYDAITGHYSLPAEHAALLTRQAAPNNMAVAAAFIPMLSHVEDEIVTCFREGGGVPYEGYHRFHEVMAEESSQTVVLPLVDTILPLAPEIQTKLEQGARVVDFGCGKGRAITALAKAYPNSRFWGYDLCKETVAAALEESKGISNVTFEQRDVAGFDESETFDIVFTFDSVHDQADPARLLANIYRALRPDGVYLMQDIAGSSQVERNLDHPMAPFMYTVSCMHCMSVSLAQGGAGLGAMWGEELAEQMVRAAGFRHFEKKTLEHDFMNNFYIIRK